MKRFLPHPFLTLFLTAIWLLLVNTLSLGHMLLGLFLGCWIPLLCRRFIVDMPAVRKPLKLLRFILVVFYDIVEANVSVARLVLDPKERLNPAFVEVPMDIRNEFLLSALMSVVSMTPGTVSAGLNEDHTVLLVHGLDIPDAEELIAQIKSRYEAPLMEIFAC